MPEAEIRIPNHPWRNEGLIEAQKEYRSLQSEHESHGPLLKPPTYAGRHCVDA